MTDKLKALILGCGSIGRRHLRNLRLLGVKDFILCDPNEGALRQAAEGLQDPVLARGFKEALPHSPDLAVVCTPSSMHLDMSVELASRGVHLLIEKPLSHNLDNIDILKRTVESKGVVAMMAMCYRFHPVLRSLKVLLDSGAIGALYHVNYYGGQYLPDWHPYADYRREYAANRSMGGGVVLTTIHGLDDIRWIFGEPETALSVTDKVSDLEMDVEDLVMSIFKIRGGPYVFWQTDYLQRAKQHRMIITGSDGTVRCDISGGVLEVYTVKDGWRTEKIDFDVNSMYVDETRSFLECIERKAMPSIDIEEGRKTLELAMKVKKEPGRGACAA